MTTETVNILAIVLGFLGVLVALIAILVQLYFSKWTGVYSNAMGSSSYHCWI